MGKFSGIYKKRHFVVMDFTEPAARGEAFYHPVFHVSYFAYFERGEELNMARKNSEVAQRATGLYNFRLISHHDPFRSYHFKAETVHYYAPIRVFACSTASSMVPTM